MSGEENHDDTTTYVNEASVLRYNLGALDVRDIENDIEHLLFVEHEEDMKNYTHLLPLVKELAQLTVRTADRAVYEFQHTMTQRISTQLQETIGEQIANVVHDARMPMTETLTVRTTVDDDKVLVQTTERESAPKKGHHDW